MLITASSLGMPCAGDVVDVGGEVLQGLAHDAKSALLVADSMPLQVQDGAPMLRYRAGGLFGLFELSHAAVPGQPVTVFIAKQGLRVAFCEEGGSEKPIHGTLMRPLHLGVNRRPVGASNAGAGPDSGPKGSRGAATTEIDPNTVWWEVAWDRGKVSTLAVGTNPSMSAMRVADVEGFGRPPVRGRRQGRPGDELVRIEMPVVHYPLPDGVPDLSQQMQVSCGCHGSIVSGTVWPPIYLDSGNP